MSKRLNTTAMKKQYNIPSVQIETAEAISIMAISSIDDIVIHDKASDGEILSKEYDSDDDWDSDW